MGTTSFLTVGGVVLGAITLARHADFTSRFYEDEQVAHLSEVGQALATSTDVLIAIAAASAIVTLAVGLVWRHRVRVRRDGVASPTAPAD